jgi:histidine ammonia-lyase
LASENKTLAHPASADTIATSNNKEDFVSMGMWSAIKLKKIAWNCAQVVAIELLSASQALEFHRPLRSGPRIEEGLRILRARVPPSRSDEVLSEKLQLARDMILAGDFDPLFDQMS